MYQYQVLCDGEILTDQRHPDYRISEGKLTRKVSAAGSLSITIPLKAAKERHIRRMHSLIEVVKDDRVIWNGRCTDNTRSKPGAATINAEGALCVLKDTLIGPATFSGYEENVMRAIITAHGNMGGVNQTFSVDVSGFPMFLRSIEAKSPTATWTVIENLIKDCGGYIIPQYYGFSTKYAFKWVRSITDTCAQIVREGQGLDTKSLKITEDASGTYNAIYPIGKKPKEQQVQDADNNLYLTDFEYSNGDFFSDYGSPLLYLNAGVRFRRIMTKTYSEITDKRSLALASLRDLESAMQETVRVDAKAIDWSYVDPSIEPLEIGKRVRVISPSYEFDDYVPIMEENIDLVRPQRSVFTLGGSKVAISRMVKA